MFHLKCRALKFGENIGIFKLPPIRNLVLPPLLPLWLVDMLPLRISSPVPGRPPRRVDGRCSACCWGVPVAKVDAVPLREEEDTLDPYIDI